MAFPAQRASKTEGQAWGLGGVGWARLTHLGKLLQTVTAGDTALLMLLHVQVAEAEVLLQTQEVTDWASCSSLCPAGFSVSGWLGWVGSISKTQDDRWYGARTQGTGTTAPHPAILAGPTWKLRGGWS